MPRIFLLILLMLAPTIAGAQTSVPQPSMPMPPTADPRLGCDTVSAFPMPDLGEPQNIDVFKKQLVYYRCHAYDDDVTTVLDAARKWVAARASEVKMPAIVLDIDETSLTN